MSVKKNNKRLNLSFTLIEIIIILGILLISTGISLSFYNRFNQETDLEVEVNKITDLINLAKKKSMSYDISLAGEDCQFSGFQIFFPSNNQYQLQLCCRSDCLENVNLNSFKLKLNIILMNYPSAITFFPTLGKTDKDYSLIVKHNLINKCKQININKEGVVNINNITCP
jgi:Tfp pilus assembly protein FimT